MTKDTQTKNFKGVHKRIVYDYGYGEGQVREHGCQVKMVETRDNVTLSDIRMDEVMSGVEQAETIQKAIKRITDIATTEKNIFENRIRSLEETIAEQTEQLAKSDSQVNQLIQSL